VWAFPGKGDNETYSDSFQIGSTVTGSFNVGYSVSATAGIPNVYSVTVGKNVNVGIQCSQSAYHTANDTYSSSNYHTGPLCRRYVAGQSSQVVTLYVYRMTPEGGAEGKSITVNVDLIDARDRAGSGGVSYE
jgi:hypothetical protein